MKRTFEIEFPDDYDPFWMNKDNLLLCLNAYCPNTFFNVKDITQDTLVVSIDKAPEDFRINTRDVNESVIKVSG